MIVFLMHPSVFVKTLRNDLTEVLCRSKRVDELKYSTSADIEPGFRNTSTAIRVSQQLEANINMNSSNDTLMRRCMHELCRRRVLIA